MTITTSYLLNESSNEADMLVEDKLISSLESITGFTYNATGANNLDDSFKIERSSKVGASVAGDIKSSSYTAILWSLVGIFIYILIRFRKWEYSVASIVALIHGAVFVIAGLWCFWWCYLRIGKKSFAQTIQQDATILKYIECISNCYFLQSENNCRRYHLICPKRLN